MCGLGTGTERQTAIGELRDSTTPDALSVKSLATTHPSVVNLARKLRSELGGGGREKFLVEESVSETNRIQRVI